MSKWGVPQFSSFNVNVDLVGKAWKTVENSIDKAIGISTEGAPPQSPSQVHAPHNQQATNDNKSPTPTKAPPASPTSTSPMGLGRESVSTPNKPSPKPSPQKLKPSGDDLSLEVLLNGPSPIPSPSKTTPKITSLQNLTSFKQEPKPTSTSTLTPTPTPVPFLASTPTVPAIRGVNENSSETMSIAHPKQDLKHTIDNATISETIGDTNHNETINSLLTAHTTTSTYQDEHTPTEHVTKHLTEEVTDKVTPHKAGKATTYEPPTEPTTTSIPPTLPLLPVVSSKSDLAPANDPSSLFVSPSPSSSHPSPTCAPVTTQSMDNGQFSTADHSHKPEALTLHHTDAADARGDISLDPYHTSKTSLDTYHPSLDTYHPSKNDHDEDPLLSNDLLLGSEEANVSGLQEVNASVQEEVNVSVQEEVNVSVQEELNGSVHEEGVTRSSSSSSLMELTGSEATELELKSKIVELNGKISAIAIVEKEKDRQLEEKTKQLAIREKQLESAMERHATMSSELQNLTEEVEKLRHKSSSSSSSSSPNDLVESLKEEFSRRLGVTEKKLQAVTKERDELKKGVSLGDQAKGVVKAKDDEINTLRTEGTNLSLKILNLESALKKYRASKKEDDTSLQALREKLTQAEALLEKRNDRVKQLEFSEKKYLETITTMKDVSDMAARKLEKKEQEHNYALKQIQELQNNLDKATKDLLGAKKTTQEVGDKYLNEVEEAKRSVASEYQMQNNKQAQDFQGRFQQQEAVIIELRGTLSSLTEQAGRKEDSLLREILHLRESLDAAEKRNEEIMQSIPDSTRPLLRQIESLRSLLETKSSSADSVEKDLRARLADEEARCITALEKDRSSSSALAEVTHRLAALEIQYEEEHNLVSRLRTEVETIKLDEKKYKRMVAELSAKQTAAELQEDCLNSELRQNDERHQRTISSMKELEEALTKAREKEKEAREELNKLHRFDIRRSSSTNLVELTGSNSSLGQSSPSGNGVMTGSALLSAPLRSDPGSLPLVERLQAMLSQRDGEIAVLHSQLSSLEAARKDLQEELTVVSSTHESLSGQAVEFHTLKAEAKELQQRFATALQLVGEKEEQVMELKMDLKEMYRTQISELIEQNENLKKKK